MKSPASLSAPSGGQNQTLYNRIDQLQRELDDARRAQKELERQRELARIRQQRRRDANREEMREYWANYKRDYRARKRSEQQDH